MEAGEESSSNSSDHFSHSQVPHTHDREVSRRITPEVLKEDILEG
jgi:hypothetical protein